MAFETFFLRGSFSGKQKGRRKTFKRLKLRTTKSPEIGLIKLLSIPIQAEQCQIAKEDVLFFLCSMNVVDHSTAPIHPKTPLTPHPPFVVALWLSGARAAASGATDPPASTAAPRTSARAAATGATASQASTAALGTSGRAAATGATARSGAPSSTTTTAPSARAAASGAAGRASWTCPATGATSARAVGCGAVAPGRRRPRCRPA